MADRWRKFRKWAGFPVYEDIPLCPGCGEKMTLGEFPAYPWVCRSPSTGQCPR